MLTDQQAKQAIALISRSPKVVIAGHDLTEDAQAEALFLLIKEIKESPRKQLALELDPIAMPRIVKGCFITGRRNVARTYLDSVRVDGPEDTHVVSVPLEFKHIEALVAPAMTRDPMESAWEKILERFNDGLLSSVERAWLAAWDGSDSSPVARIRGGIDAVVTVYLRDVLAKQGVRASRELPTRGARRDHQELRQNVTAYLEAVQQEFRSLVVA